MICPRDNIEMDEVRKLDVVIDICSKCGGVWLDKGELDKLREAWQEVREEDEERYRDEDKERPREKRPERDDDRYERRRRRRESIFSMFEGIGGGD